MLAVAVVALLLVGSGSAVADAATEGTGNQPDAMVRRTGIVAFTGNNRYNSNGTNQTLSRTAPPGVMVSYGFRMQNDGDTVDFLTPSGCAGGPRFLVRWFLPQPGDDIDITSSIVAGALSVGRNPGQSEDYRVEVTVRNAAPLGAALDCRFRVTTGSAPNQLRDVARLVVRRG